MRKHLITVALFFLTACIANAQLKSPLSSIRPQLEQVIKEFPSHFSGIRGAAVSDNEQAAEFESKVVVKEAIETKLIAFSNQKYKSWVWECRLFETDDINKMKRLYKNYYNDIAGNSLIGKPHANALQPVSEYSSPDGELRLYSNQFRMGNDDDAYKHLVVDLVAEYINFQWSVYVRVYDKEKDEEIRPTEKNIRN
jgi:hypothetical protein